MAQAEVVAHLVIAQAVNSSWRLPQDNCVLCPGSQKWNRHCKLKSKIKLISGCRIITLSSQGSPPHSSARHKPVLHLVLLEGPIVDVPAWPWVSHTSRRQEFLLPCLHNACRHFRLLKQYLSSLTISTLVVITVQVLPVKMLVPHWINM